MTERSGVRGWLSYRLLEAVGLRFLEGARRLPAGRLRAWVVQVVAGGVVLLGLDAAITLWAADRIGASRLGWEVEVSRALASLPPRLDLALWLDIYGNALFCWPAALLAWGVMSWRRQPLRALCCFPGFALCEVLILLGWRLWARTRPDLIDAGPQGESFHSFPSGHVVHVVYLFGLLAWLWASASRSRGERVLSWLCFLLVALSISYLRVRTGAHWPTDVLFGWLLGGGWLGVVIAATRRQERP